MGYDKKVNEAAWAQLEQRRQSAESAAAAALEDFYARCPRALEVKRQMASNAAQAGRDVVSGGDVRAALEKRKERGLTLSREYEELLASCGLTPQDVAPRYACPDCKDTGFVDGRMCRCLKQLRKNLAYRQLSGKLPLAESTFESFSLDYYREDPEALRQMTEILRACQTYAQRFRGDSPSLLFKGGTGLGKTHLSLAIANEALEKGFGVVYGSAQSFAMALEKERFRQEGEGAGDQMKSCDLLILDDLGTEFPSAYVNAALYDVVNSRMLAGCPTIISTNLTLKELEGRYSPRFASRIAGSYGKLEFRGRDVRIQKRKTGQR